MSAGFTSGEIPRRKAGGVQGLGKVGEAKDFPRPKVKVKAPRKGLVTLPLFRNRGAPPEAGKERVRPPSFKVGTGPGPPTVPMRNRANGLLWTPANGHRCPHFRRRSPGSNQHPIFKAQRMGANSPRLLI